MNHDEYQSLDAKILTTSFVVLMPLTLIGFVLIALRFGKGFGSFSHMGDGLNFVSMQFSKLGLPIPAHGSPARFSEKIRHTVYKDFIAQVALYGTLCFIAIKSMRWPGDGAEKQDKGDKTDGSR
jgi:hypothetical protein